MLPYQHAALRDGMAMAYSSTQNFTDRATGVMYAQPNIYDSAGIYSTANPLPIPQNDGGANNPSNNNAILPQRDPRQYTISNPSDGQKSNTPNWDHRSNAVRMHKLIMTVSTPDFLYVDDEKVFHDGYKRSKTFRDASHQMVLYLRDHSRDVKSSPDIREMDRRRFEKLMGLVGKAGGEKEINEFLRKKGGEKGGKGKGKKEKKGEAAGGGNLLGVRGFLGLNL